MTGQNSPGSESGDTLGDFLDRMIQHRNSVCYEHALNVDHRHCIGCVLVMKHMQENFPNMQYGTEEQWVQESAFCALHERELFREFFAAEQERKNGA